ncbi:MAG: hypothetical protein ACKO04_13540, partial [Actinomycetes bacterium]
MGVGGPDEDLVVRPGRVVPVHELEERFSPSGGPGGTSRSSSGPPTPIRPSSHPLPKSGSCQS